MTAAATAWFDMMSKAAVIGSLAVAGSLVVLLVFVRGEAGPVNYNGEAISERTILSTPQQHPTASTAPADCCQSQQNVPVNSKTSTPVAGCILIGASSNHFGESMCTLPTLAYPSVKRIIYIDMGLEPSQRHRAAAAILANNKVPGVNQTLSFHSPREYMPQHLYTFKAKNAGFKPIAISHLMTTRQLAQCERVWYVDASIRFNKDPFLVEVAASTGMRGVSLRIHTNVRWTHPGMYKHFGLRRPDDRLVQMQSGTVLFDPKSPHFKQILDSWEKCCRNFECVMPPGSTRAASGKPPMIEGVEYAAHRDDQSAMNLAIWSQAGVMGHYETAFDETSVSWNGTEFLRVFRSGRC